jgi:hypothetical protein
MSSLESDGDGGNVTKATEGGQKPALYNEALNTYNASRSTNTEPTSTEGIGKVLDLETFRSFVQKMAIRHQNGAVSRADALSMVGSVATVRKLTDTFGAEAVRQVVESELPDTAAEQAVQVEATLPPLAGVVTADQLQLAEFAPVMFVVPRLIAEGVTLLAGKPKLGKSWLMLDIALGVASGKPVLGNMPVLQGDVLGLFLEDSQRRLQARIRRLETASGKAWPTNLSLTTQWRRFDEGGLSDIEAWCRQADNPKLIITDTLAKLRPSRSSRKAQYDLDYEALTGLHKIAHKFQVAIIVVHHTRKAEADDVFDTVSGTLGLTGAADSILVLSRRSGKAVLHARGRDIEDSETALKFDPTCCRWIALGEASDIFVSDERARIRLALDGASEPMSPKELMLAAGIKNRNSIDILLLKMVREGQIVKVTRGRYVSAGKIGKKDSPSEQATEETQKIVTLGDLSDLSANEGPGGAGNERTTP